MTTTTKERAHVLEQLYKKGISYQDAHALRRIAMQLHNWHEKECGTDHGCIERDETTGKASWLDSTTMKRYPVRDMETGALQRLTVLMTERYPQLYTYVQTDPRGASLYILTKEQTQDRNGQPQDLDSIYSRGVAVY